MSYECLRRGDYLNAYGAYEAAVEKYLGTTGEVSGGRRCRYSMAMIKDRQTNSDLDIDFERPYMDNDNSLFYSALSMIHLLLILGYIIPFASMCSHSQLSSCCSAV